MLIDRYDSNTLDYEAMPEDRLPIQTREQSERSWGKVQQQQSVSLLRGHTECMNSKVCGNKSWTSRLGIEYEA